MPLIDCADSLLRHHVGDAAPVGKLVEVRPPSEGHDPRVQVTVVTDRAEWGVHLYGAVRSVRLFGPQSEMSLFFAGEELGTSLAVEKGTPWPEDGPPDSEVKEAPAAPPYVEEYFLRIARDEPGLSECSDQQLLDAAAAVSRSCGCLFGEPPELVDDVAAQLVENGYLPDFDGARLVAINADALS